MPIYVYTYIYMETEGERGGERQRETFRVKRARVESIVSYLVIIDPVHHCWSLQHKAGLVPPCSEPLYGAWCCCKACRGTRLHQVCHGGPGLKPVAAKQSRWYRESCTRPQVLQLLRSSASAEDTWKRLNFKGLVTQEKKPLKGDQ